MKGEHSILHLRHSAGVTHTGDKSPVLKIAQGEKKFFLI
ncbi:hypothetical protein EC2845650_3036 [Escherichia coli 2845650]|nr:hypothetical protein EC2845650_3036 [Escherichia coli 2845650]